MRITAIGYNQQNIKSRNANKKLAKTAFTANPVQTTVRINVAESLLKAENIKKEANEIINEAKIILERIRKKDTDGLLVSNGFVYVLDPNGIRPSSSNRRFGFVYDNLTDFWEHDPKTEHVKNSFCFDYESGKLQMHTEYKSNPRVEDIIDFDENGLVTTIKKYYPTTQFGRYVKIENGKNIGNNGVFQGRFNCP